MRMFFVRCRHRWSLPITVRGETYQRCVDCSLRRSFDAKRWLPGKPLRRELMPPRAA